MSNTPIYKAKNILDYINEIEKFKNEFGEDGCPPCNKVCNNNCNKCWAKYLEEYIKENNHNEVKICNKICKLGDKVRFLVEHFNGRRTIESGVIIRIEGLNKEDIILESSYADILVLKQSIINVEILK